MGVLGHQRQAESRADAVARSAAAGEPFEDPRTFAAGNAGAGVIHDQHDAGPTARLDRNPEWPATVFATPVLLVVVKLKPQ